MTSPYAGYTNTHTPEIPVQPYAKAIIASLREELEQERNAHAQTRTHTQAKVLALSACVARRDALLEAYNSQGVESRMMLDTAEECHARAEQQDSAQRRSEEPPFVRPAFSREEAIQILELTAARNRELEEEVRHLRHSVSLSSIHATSRMITYDPYRCSPRG